MYYLVVPYALKTKTFYFTFDLQVTWLMCSDISLPKHWTLPSKIPSKVFSKLPKTHHNGRSLEPIFYLVESPDPCLLLSCILLITLVPGEFSSSNAILVWLKNSLLKNWEFSVKPKLHLKVTNYVNIFRALINIRLWLLW